LREFIVQSSLDYLRGRGTGATARYVTHQKRVPT